MTDRLKVSTLFEFLDSVGTPPRILDMGRRISPIPREDFLRFEKTEIPYPLPLQQQAWMAFLLGNSGGTPERFVWFLRFPLDEQGKLVQAARDDFMHRLLEQIGENAEALKQGNGLEKAVEGNPYSFKPRDDRLAVFHAAASRLLGDEASRYFAHARGYFSGSLGWDQWPFVGYQGIADMAARAEVSDNAAVLAAAVPVLPLRPLEALCHCLENAPTPVELSRALFDRGIEELNTDQPDTRFITAVIRGISLSDGLSGEFLRKVLDAPCSRDPGVLSAIAAKSWENLTDPSLAESCLRQLADNSDGQEVFNACMADLLFLPGMREPLMKVLRDPDRTPPLSRAMGAFFRQLTGKPGQA